MVYKQQMNPGSGAEEPVVTSVWPLRKPVSPPFLTVTAPACARWRGRCGRGDPAAPAECRVPSPTSRSSWEREGWQSTRDRTVTATRTLGVENRYL